MTHASVFSGIGGPEVAATMLGWENLFHCEINPFGRQVLDYWYPNSKSYEDITTTDFTEWRGRVDVLTGGFPCQPFSYAGRRRGAEDDRYLWPSMYRAIDEIQPTWVVAENVAGILTMVEQGDVSKVAGTATLFDAFDDLRGRYELRETFTLQRICTDLESHGYAVQPVLVPACAVGAPHRRDRVFIVARRVNQGEDEAVLQSKRTIFDTADERPRGTTDGRTTGEVRGEVREEGHHAELRVSTETSSGDGNAPDTMRSRCNRQVMFGQGEGNGHELDSDIARPCGESSAETSHARLQGSDESRTEESRMREHLWRIVAGHGVSDGAGRDIRTTESDHCGERWQNFPSVSPVHRGNDGLPFDVDRLTLSFGKWRTEALKAYGNAIVPQVMYEIFRAIEIVEQQNNEL